MQLARLGILAPMTARQEASWLRVRKQGKHMFGFARGILLGLSVLTSFTLVDCLVAPFLEGRSTCTVREIIAYWSKGHYILVILCFVGGLILGYAGWYYKEMQYIISVGHRNHKEPGGNRL